MPKTIQAQTRVHGAESGATVRDVAHRAGVSIGTVSRALKHQPGLNDDTRQRVLGAAFELGYDTNNLRTSKLRRVSFLMSRLSNLAVNPFYSHVLHGVEQACRQEEIVLSYTSLQPGDRAIEIIRRHEANGLICAGHFEPKLLEHIASLGLPVVLVDHAAPGYTSMNIDNIAGAKRAVLHLIENGYCRIAFINGSPSFYPIRQRLLGFRQALYEAGIPADPRLEITPNVPFSMEGAEQAMRTLLQMPVRPDAVFVINDESALWAMRVCLDASLRIPDDIAFVGFDDIVGAAHSSPPLSTVWVDKELLGRRGLELLRDREHASNVQLVLPTELIVRESSLPRKTKSRGLS